jgi:hypothetical protein
MRAIIVRVLDCARSVSNIDRDKTRHHSHAADPSEEKGTNMRHLFLLSW